MKIQHTPFQFTFFLYCITSLYFQQHQVSGLSVSPPITGSSYRSSNIASNSFFTGSGRTTDIGITDKAYGTLALKHRSTTSLHAARKSSLESFFTSFSDVSTKGIFITLLLALIFNSFTIISPGEVGVISTLGKVSQVDPGFHLINPLSQVIPFTTKTQLLDLENYVPTKEGLTVELDTAVLYKIDPNSAKDIYQNIGPKYEATIIVPEVSSAVRGFTSESDSKALYSGGGRNLIQNNLKRSLSERLDARGIIVEDVLLKNLKLPTELTSSIEAKAKAEQESERMEFVLAKERQEADRKAVEAQGIADFQRIVSDNISPNVLKWKGIEATQKLAQSPNAKIVVIGSGKDGLPLILGGGSDNK